MADHERANRSSPTGGATPARLGPPTGGAVERVGGPSSPGGLGALPDPVEASFGRRAEAPGQARAWVRAAMTAWQVDDPDGTVLLTLSELATNAVVHGASEFTVRVSCEAGGLVIGVRDHSPAAPVHLAFSEASERGRGLGIVRALASATGVEEHGVEGKTVWARIPVGVPGR